MNGSVRGSATLLSAFVIAALGALSASAQLNPTVKVLPKPQTSVPPECEQGLAPAVPRVIVAEAAQETKPARAVPPPSLDLKTQLRAVQLAAERGDRDAFKAALADARAAVASYPPGGERSAANDVVGVDSDLERLWDYEFTSPTGAFFDSSTDFVAMMRRYPDYARAISDQTLNVGAQTMYPSVETRRFLVAEASRRLNSLGVRTPTRITELPPPPKPAPQPGVAPQPPPVPRTVPEKPAVRKAERTPPRTTPRTTPHPSPHKAAKKPAAKKTKPPVKVAEARTPSTKPRASEPAPQPAPIPKPAPTPQPVAPPPPRPAAVPAPVPAPSPQPPPSPAPTTTTAIPPLPTDTMSKTETTATTATTATTTTTAPAQTPAAGGGRMNLLFAIILIIVGIGVLIILFRASD